MGTSPNQESHPLPYMPPSSSSSSAMSITSSGTETPELDLAVKGSLPVPAAGPTPTQTPIRSPPAPPGNPLDTAPSSPSQVYLNLLILEASLRSQYLHHLARRRKFTFFLILLTGWVSFFFHRIYILGGSPYTYISHLEWLGLLGGTITGTLYYATGLYQSTIVEPRRFVYTANRGLRGFNVKLVKVPFSTMEWISWWWTWYTFRPPPRPPRPPPSSASTRRLSSNASPKPRRLSATRSRPATSDYRHTPSISGRTTLSPHVEEAGGDTEDETEEFLPGGLHLKLVILPKRFSAGFREDWELYRAEYWERENEARAVRRRESRWRPWSRGPKPGEKDLPDPPPPPMVARVRRNSVASERRSPSVSSRAGTPEPEGSSPAGKRRGSLIAKRRPGVASGLVGVRAAPGDISDSGSTTTERRRRSDSPVTDRSSSSAGTTGKRKSGVKGKGRGRKSAVGAAATVAGSGEG